MAPLSFRILVVAILVMGRTVSTNPAFGLVLARVDDEAPLEPLVFYGLTLEEFTAKVAEHRENRTRRDLGGTSDSVLLGKRDRIGGEIENTDAQQDVVEARSSGCVTTFGPRYRATVGNCHEKNPRRMVWYCSVFDRGTMAGRRRERSQMCQADQRCAEMAITNFFGHRKALPYCQDKIAINKPTGDGIQLVPEYEGYKTLPYEVWSPGTIDTHWQLESELAELKGHWEYRGHYASGRTYINHSAEFSHSWSCIGCPSGTLYIATVGFMSHAVGFTRRVSRD